MSAHNTLHLPPALTELANKVFYERDRIDQFVLAMPEERRGDWQSLLATYMIAVNQLQEDCTPQSVAKAVYNGVRLGLACGPPLNHAHLVPMRDGKMSKRLNREVYVCQLWPGYQGLLDLALGSGFIENIAPMLILAGEDWREWTEDHRIRLYHDIPKERDTPNEDNIVAAYCVWQTVNGGGGHLVVRAKEWGAQRSKWRRSPAPFEAMVLKTPICRASKYWKKTKYLGRAVSLDEQIEQGRLQDAPGFDEEQGEQKSLKDVPEPEESQELDDEQEFAESAARAERAQADDRYK